MNDSGIWTGRRVPILSLSDEDVLEPESPTGQYPDPVWIDQGDGTAGSSDGSYAAGTSFDYDEDDVPEPPSPTGQYPDPVWVEGEAESAGLAFDSIPLGRSPVLPPAPGPVSRARMLGEDTGVSGPVIERVTGRDGKITWDLDQLRGVKHPDDMAPGQDLPLRAAPVIRLEEWPYDDTQDPVAAWFAVNWQYDGRSLGNIRIENTGTVGASSRELKVRATIADDRVLYPHDNPACAALLVRFSYRFSSAAGPVSAAVTELHLFGDGTFEKTSRWEQG